MRLKTLVEAGSNYFKIFHANITRYNINYQKNLMMSEQIKSNPSFASFCVVDESFGNLISI